MDMVRSMNYGQEDNPRLITFVCGAVQLRLRYLIQTLGNLIPRQSVAILLAIQKSLRDVASTVPTDTRSS